MSEFTRKRFIEIAFYNIYAHILKAVGDTYTEMYLQTFCKIYDIDYSSITILRNMYLRKMRPTKRELSIFATLVKMPYKLIPVDYRTIRAHKRQYYEEGEPNLYPVVRNEALRGDIKLFVERYLKFYPNELSYLRFLEMESD